MADNTATLVAGNALIADPTVWQRLPNSGPLQNGLNLYFTFTGGGSIPVQISTSNTGKIANDGTGAGYLVDEDDIPVFIPVRNANALFIAGGDPGCIATWYGN
jgi:hypothetical protein